METYILLHKIQQNNLLIKKKDSLLPQMAVKNKTGNAQK